LLCTVDECQQRIAPSQARSRHSLAKTDKFVEKIIRFARNSRLSGNLRNTSKNVRFVSNAPALKHGIILTLTNVFTEQHNDASAPACVAFCQACAVPIIQSQPTEPGTSASDTLQVKSFDDKVVFRATALL
jgi:hypothetical protein